MTFVRTLSALLLACGVTTPALSADVLVVDQSGGGDFTTLSAAVAAASSGDTVLVLPGEYSEPTPVVIDGKGLTITCEPPPPDTFPLVIVLGGLRILNLPANQRVLMENLVIGGAAGSATSPALPALVLQDNAGLVRAQACTFSGGPGDSNANPHGAVGVKIVGGGPVDFIRCFVGGGWGQFSPDLGVVAGHGAAGLEQSGGQVHLGDSHVGGGSGGGNEVGGWPDGGDGGDGVAHSGGSLFVVGGYIEGGKGGIAHIGGDGGHGLVLAGSGFVWLMADAMISGGEGGGSDFGPDGADGLDISDPSGLAVDFGGTFNTAPFTVTSPLREGQGGVMSLGGTAAGTTLLFFSLVPGQVALPGHQGVFALSPSGFLGPLVFGPPGDLALSFVAPNLPASLDALHVHLQPVHVDSQGALLGLPAFLTVLDASF